MDGRVIVRQLVIAYCKATSQYYVDHRGDAGFQRDLLCVGYSRSNRPLVYLVCRLVHFYRIMTMRAFRRLSYDVQGREDFIMVTVDVRQVCLGAVPRVYMCVILLLGGELGVS